MSYIEKNRWYITASKLKYFLTFWPEAYKLKYIDEIPVEWEEKDYFLVWTAFDDLVSYWEDFFNDKYYIDEWLLKADLIEKLWDEYKNLKVDELRDVYYWDKTRLTAWQWEQILWMYREAKRQPLADLWSDYMVQEEIIAEFEWLPLKMTLDRVNLEKKLIRDWKTTGRFDTFEYNIDTTFDYVLSMAFYFVWVKVKFWESCDVVLDVLWKQKPYPYMAYKLDKNMLLEKVQNKIIPWLRALKDCMNTWIWESIYPINYYTEWRNWEIINHTAWEPISRTKLMQCDHYNLLQWGIAEWFIEPIY